MVCHGQPFTQMLLIFELEIGQDAREALKPAAQSVSVVALTTNRMGATQSVSSSTEDPLPVVTEERLEKFTELVTPRSPTPSRAKLSRSWQPNRRPCGASRP